MQEELFAGLNCQPGFVCSRSELSQDLRALLQSGLFANVDARVQHKGKGKYTLEFTFSENLWQPIKSFKVPASDWLLKSLLDHMPILHAVCRHTGIVGRRCIQLLHTHSD